MRRLMLAMGLLLLTACSDEPEPVVEPVVEESTPVPTEAPAVEPTAEPIQEEELMDMALSVASSAFEHEEAIPVKYTCDGEDLSPELSWSGAPEGTLSFALIMDDPDAPGGTWVHWVLFNLPADATGLGEGAHGVGEEGSNSWNRTGYGGPCPPGGTHRYFFKLYALDARLDLPEGASKDQLLEAMEGHILDQAELMGVYARS